ncbi:MAG: hypothetical protein CIT03_08405 [Methanobacterium sp.]|nr:MAG: hypothetical protein CIT03_08405 [Methanobacterium sp.]
MINNGPSDAQNVQVTDSIPPQLINVEYSVNGGINWINWPPALGYIDLGTLSAGGSQEILLRGDVLSSVANGTLINNTVNATTTTPDPTPASDSTTTLVNTQADINVTKNGPASIVAGNTILYSIIVVNNGPSDALDVRVFDAVPPQLINVEYSVNGGINWINWPPALGYIDLGILTVNETRSILLRGTVNPSTPNGTNLNNTVTVTTTTPDPTPNTDTVITNVNTIADIFVNKMGPASGTAGEDIIKYTLVVGNNGPSTAESVILYDNLSFLINPEYSLNDINWFTWTGSLNLGNLTPASITTIFLRGLIPADALGVLNNTALVNSSTFDPFLENNTSSVVTDVLTVADVFVVKEAPFSVVAGEEILFTVNVGNVGPSVARDVVLVDVVVSSVVNTVYSVNGGLDWFGWTGMLVLGDLSPGVTWEVLIRGDVLADVLGEINNTALVNSSTFDPFLENNTSSVVTDVETVADIYVIKTGTPDPVLAGHENLTYNILVGNNGPSVSRNVILSDILPPMILNPVYSIDGGISWFNWTGSLNLGNFTPGQTINVLIQGLVSAEANSTIRNTANVTSDTFDPDLENNTSTADIQIKTADIGVQKDTSNLHPNYLDEIMFTITVTNYGPDQATGVEITDLLPDGLNYISSTTTQGVYDFTTGIWQIGTMEFGNSAILNIIAKVVQTGNITNTATKTAENEYDPNPDNDQDSVTLEVPPAADLAITKTVNDLRPILYDTIFFTYIVQNRGPDTAVDSRVIDVLPVGLQYVSSVANYGSYNPITGIWGIGNLPRGAIAELTITTIVTRTGNITNTAKVESLTYDPILDDTVSSVTIEVQQPKPKPDDDGKVPMQETGIPLTAILMALVLIVGGLIVPLRKK